MRHWIEDADCRDQYSVIYEAGERTAIFANDAKEPVTVEERAVSSRSQSWKWHNDTKSRLLSNKLDSAAWFVG